MGLRIAHLVHGCRTLGPGTRSVVWVRGCSRRCPGCIAGPLLGEGPSLDLSPEQLAARLLEAPEEEGVTFSGGEPFEQASLLAETARAVRLAGRGVVVFTGNDLEALQASTDAGVRALLAETDMLIDGEFLVAQHADLLWRGSMNQRIHLLSTRYEAWRDRSGAPGVGVEMRLSADSRLFWAGVPAPGFVTALRRSANEQGLAMDSQSGLWA